MHSTGILRFKTGWAVNGPFPSYLLPMCHLRGFARGLVLKMRQRATRKWHIGIVLSKDFGRVKIFNEISSSVVKYTLNILLGHKIRISVVYVSYNHEKI